MPILYHASSPSKPKSVPGVITVKQHRPWLCPLSVMLSIVIMGIAGWFYVQTNLQMLEQPHTVVEPIQSQNGQDILQQNTSLTAQNQELRSKLAILVHTVHEGQDTYADVLSSLELLQEENLNVIEELTFYKRLLASPEISKPSSVNLTNLTVDYDKELKRYFFQLVLTQWTKNAKVVRGTVQIYLTGQLNGKTKRLSMPAITSNSSKAWEYKFTYFQRIEDELNLPKGFIPNVMIVSLFSEGQQPDENRFAWEELQQKEQQTEYVGQ